jgi:primosomal protein N' (replication factor Y) (superfamily II helicase)
MSIARVALPVATSQLFDYWIPAGADVRAGAIVKVSLGRRRIAGVVTELASEASVPHDRLVPIDEVVALPPLPDDVRDLCAFVAAYYQAPLGLAFALAMPPLRAGRTQRRRDERPLALSAAGRTALPLTLMRAPVARALFVRLEPDGAVLDADAIAALSRTARRALNAWLDRGYVAPVTMSQAPPTLLQLNDAQRTAVDAIDAARETFAPFLLDGVTGSGKTEVYLSAAARSVASGGQVLMLVPEINLTPQLVARVRQALPHARTVALHSGLPEGERVSNWREAAEGTADVVLGTRLSIFAPMPRLDLIVVDEEHDGSYKQQDTVRYHARDAALWRGQRRGVRVVLGSATPSLESFVNADAGRYQRLVLERRADPRALPPVVRFVPARGESVRDGLSAILLGAIAERLRRGEQSLVFVNRRGFAPALKCVACAWEAGCPRCSARLVAHRIPPGLVCHHCGHRERVPRACPQCGNVDLAPAGHGTQRLEVALATHFPDARLARVDRDTTRQRGAFDDVRSRVAANTVDILIGTQMLAKGHDFPRLTLVGVLGADNALYSADFRATERLAALLVQVAGRAGRADLAGEVIVQTDFPAHPLYGALSRHDYGAFARELLDERRAGGLPPFAHLVLLTAEAHAREDAEAFLAAAHDVALAKRAELSANVEVFAPVAAPMARRAGYERAQMLLRSGQRGELKRLLTALRESLETAASRKVRWAIDVDPPGLA